jgi:branched-chain amino acid transport system permease protein
VCLAFALERIKPSDFSVTDSILVLSMVVIGGLGSVEGAVLGALYLVGLPAALGSTSTIQFITSGFGVLVFLLYLPGGLADLLHRAGDGVTTLLERWLARGDPPSPDPVDGAALTVTAVEP